MTYRSVARITKTHGRKGEVVAVPAHGLPPCLETGLLVWPVPPALKGPRNRRITQVYGTDHGQVVSLAGVDSIGAAKELVGKTLLADLKDLPDALVLRDAQALLGREVKDVSLGYIGEVTEVLRNPSQDVLVIEGERGEVMVPFVDAFVREVVDEGAIIVEISESLLGLAGTKGREGVADR